MRDGEKKQIAKLEPYTPALPRFRLVPFDQIKISTDPHYLIKDILPREGLVVVWGPPKCGKSFWMLDVLMHVALGRDYRGRRVAEGAVVYIACEGERGLGARIHAFREHHMAENACSPPFYLVTTRLDLVADVEVLISSIRTQLNGATCSVVAIDTLNRSLAGSESSDEDMSAYVKAADVIREAFQCAVVVIHHCGINDKRPRGHTSLVGATDAQIAITRDDKSGIIAALVEYMKDGEAGAAIHSTLETVQVGIDEEGEPIQSCVIVPAAPTLLTRPKRLGKIASLALDELHNQIIADVDDPIGTPLSKEVPRDVQGTSKSRWRARLESTGLINANGNPREELRRIVVNLRVAGLVRMVDDFIWPVTSRHNPET